MRDVSVACRPPAQIGDPLVHGFRNVVVTPVDLYLFAQELYRMFERYVATREATVGNRSARTASGTAPASSPIDALIPIRFVGGFSEADPATPRYRYA
jgi:hypothetical protein